MKIDVKMKPLNLPNFLIADCDYDITLPVGKLTDEQAAQIWDDMKPLWLGHVAKKRRELELE